MIFSSHLRTRRSTNVTWSRSFSVWKSTAWSSTREMRVWREGNWVFGLPHLQLRHNSVSPLPKLQGLSIHHHLLWPILQMARGVSSNRLAGWNFRANNVLRRDFKVWLGSPKTVTTDQGNQFESQLYNALLKSSGCDRIRTAPYHPATNGVWWRAGTVQWRPHLCATMHDSTALRRF